MTPEERALKESALAGFAAPASGADRRPGELTGGERATAPRLEPRPFRLRALAARLLGVGEAESDRRG